MGQPVSLYLLCIRSAVRRCDSCLFHASNDFYVHAVTQTAACSILILVQECPESIPYTLAVYNAKSQSSSSERQTFLQQVTANQDKLTKLEQVFSAEKNGFVV